MIVSDVSLESRPFPDLYHQAIPEQHTTCDSNLAEGLITTFRAVLASHAHVYRLHGKLHWQ